MAHATPRTVWITGASSGIGRALAHRYARDGARLVLSARRVHLLESLRAELPPSTDVRLEPLDLTDLTAIQRSARAVLAWSGGVDVLVNNAGVSHRSHILDTDEQVEQHMMAVNYFGPVALTRAVARDMVRRGRGRVVNVSSVTGYVATPGKAAYAASKHALRGWSDALRAELYPFGVTVTVVCPGFVRTDIGRSALDGSGAPMAVDDPAVHKGMPPEAAAERIFQAARRGRREVQFGGLEVLTIYLKRFTPGFGAWLLAKVYERLDRIEEAPSTST